MPTDSTAAARGDADQVALFHRTLAEMVRGGLPLGRALALLAQDLGRSPLADAARAIEQEVERGASLAEAYRRHERALPPLYAALIEAGLAAGDLAGTLEEIARHAARAARVRARVREVLAPMLVTAGFLVVIGAGLTALALAGGLGLSLTEAARVEAPLGHFEGWRTVESLAFAALLAAVVSALLAFTWLRGPLEGGRTSWRWRDRLPIVGPLRAAAGLADLTGTLALLFERRVPLDRALGLAATATAHDGLRPRLEAARRAAEGGMPLAEGLAHAGVVPPSLAWLVGAAEARGEAAAALRDLSAIYEDRVARLVDRARLLAVPALEVVLGALVLAFVWALVVPMYSVTGLAELL